MKYGKVLKFGAPLLVLAGLAGVFVAQSGTKPATATELAEVAIGQMKAKQPEQARETFRKALAMEPNNERALYGAAHLALQEKRLDDAENYLKAAYKVNPDNINVILTLGAVYQKGGASKQAEQLYAAVRKAQPGNAAAVYNLAMLAIDRKDYTGSKSLFEEYLRMVPNAPDRNKVLKRIKLLEAHIRARKERKSK
jgi:Tfp pilus assembly protein PilF